MANLKSKLDQEQAHRESIANRLQEAIVSDTALTTGKKEFSERIATLKRQLAMSETGRTSERETARRLQGQIRELETQVDTFAKGSEMSGLWRFRNNVVELVDHNDDSESDDWTIDYFLYLNEVGGKVTGALFGVHEIKTADNKGNSQSFAEISGQGHSHYLQRVWRSRYMDGSHANSQGTAY